MFEMNDPLFPSGPWVGYYNYSRLTARHGMDLHLEFANGVLSGDGVDDVGHFIIHGVYSNQSLEASWTKTYPASHTVGYRGFREGKGIWGTWEIKAATHGGFIIWPLGAGEGDEAKAEAETKTVTETRSTAGEPEKVPAPAPDPVIPKET
jgi:hypothetical protein